MEPRRRWRSGLGSTLNTFAASHGGWRGLAWRTYQRYLAKSDKPILVGPFHSELGFEALYWLPFLAQLRHTYGIAPERLIPITRGGTGILYGTPQAVELYGMRTPQDVRVETRIQQQRTGSVKQTHITPFDRQIIKDAAESLNLRDYHVLHPAWVYQVLRPYWEAQRGLAWVQPHLRFEPLPALNLEGVALPERFVAVRYYFRATLPATPTVIEFAKQSIRMLAKSQPVVILTSGHHLDDHFDYVPKDVDNVTVLSDLVTLTPQNNLAIQAAVLSKAQGYVGTYGGMAQLALRLGKPAITVYDEWQGTALPHRHLSEALALQMGTAFSVTRIGDLPLLQAALPTVTISRPSS